MYVTHTYTEGHLCHSNYDDKTEKISVDHTLEFKKNHNGHLSTLSKYYGTLLDCMQEKTYIRMKMTENVEFLSMTVGGISFVDHFWKKTCIIYNQE
jgi:hypothetical protein